jgi:myosin heavy chain 9/10/11/14
VNDAQDFAGLNVSLLKNSTDLKSALRIMGIDANEQMNLWKTISAILHLGNIVISSDRSDQARISDLAQAELACHILGIPADAFVKAVLNPRVRAGREWVNQSRTQSQAVHSLEALAKALYEKAFGYLVERINLSMDRPSASKTSFIGVLDIAGFEIFQVRGLPYLHGLTYTDK